MTDYSKGKIYKIIDNTNDKIYIGSTIQTLEARLIGHKSESKNNSVKNNSSKIILKNDDFDIELIENHPCNTKRELEIREQYFMDKLDCVNLQKAYRTREDRLKMNRIFDKKRTRDHKPYLKQYREYRSSWGGDKRFNNNMLETDVNLFQ
tara:strand:- start:47 stop:496 length:450 start_codon:yes stop_codon:yes gene_type:complete